MSLDYALMVHETGMFGFVPSCLVQKNHGAGGKRYAHDRNENWMPENAKVND